MADKTPTPHIGAKYGEIAPVVIMAGRLGRQLCLAGGLHAHDVVVHNLQAYHAGGTCLSILDVDSHEVALGLDSSLCHSGKQHKRRHHKQLYGSSHFGYTIIGQIYHKIPRNPASQKLFIFNLAKCHLATSSIATGVKCGTAVCRTTRTVAWEEKTGAGRVSTPHDQYNRD